MCIAERRRRATLFRLASVTYTKHQSSDNPSAARIAAHDLEALELARLAELLSNRHRIADLVGMEDADAVSRA